MTWEVVRWIPLLALVSLWSGIMVYPKYRAMFPRRDEAADRVVWEVEESLAEERSALERLAAQWAAEDAQWAKEKAERDAAES